MLRLAAAFLCLASLAGASHAQSWTPLEAADVNRAGAAMVSIYCRIGNTQRAYVSSGVVVRPASAEGERRGEVVITTAHGVGHYGASGRGQCFVVGPDGAHYRILRTFNPPALASSWDDWAVVVTEQPFSGAATRLPVREVPAFSGEIPVAMVGRGFANPACRLERSDRINDGGRLVYTHDCGSRRGLSGAPILARVDGEVAVVAINVGRLAMGGRIDDDSIARGVADGFDVMIRRGFEASSGAR